MRESSCHASCVATLRALENTKEFVLEGETIVGRSPNCAMRLDDQRVSAPHATLRWLHDRWVIRDLNSTNGTWVNGQRVEPQAEVVLATGDRIVFGHADHEWEVSNIDPPAPMATPLAGGPSCVIKSGVIAIPSDEEPIATIFRDSHGGWLFESEEEVRRIESGDVVTIGSSWWRFSSPYDWQSTTRTTPLRLLSDATLAFQVSRDEEYVSLAASAGTEFIDLGSHAAYYFLLTLARAREKDVRQGVEEGEAGWVHREELARMLVCNEPHLNVWIHRIRAKLENHGFLDYSAIVERKERTGMMRIGVSRITVNAA